MENKQLILAGERYLAKALDSMFAQKYPRLEIIVVDVVEFPYSMAPEFCEAPYTGGRIRLVID